MSSNNAPSAASNDRLVASSQAEENEGCYVRSRRRNRDAKVPGSKALNFRKKISKISNNIEKKSKMETIKTDERWFY